jgi:hypothetical protein
MVVTGDSFKGDRSINMSVRQSIRNRVIVRWQRGIMRALKECREVSGEQGATSAGGSGGEIGGVGHTMVGELTLSSARPQEGE